MTHDSIGLGEDGPTHQPIEHLAALRAIPNCFVMRPCDAVEVAECWQAALERRDGPSILSLTRQNLPTLRTDGALENLSAKGAYILAEASSVPLAILIATGSEVEIAIKAREQLEKLGIPTRVVSAPCLELFARQSKAYQDSIFPPGPCRVAIEAALRFGWDKWIGQDGVFIGMTGFGESAPAEELYRHFGITPEAVVETVKKKL
jgi:transketolase